MGRFEANNGGDEYADKVDELLRADSIYAIYPQTPSNQAKCQNYSIHLKSRDFIYRR